MGTLVQSWAFTALLIIYILQLAIEHAKADGEWEEKGPPGIAGEAPLGPPPPRGYLMGAYDRIRGSLPSWERAKSVLRLPQSGVPRIVTSLWTRNGEVQPPPQPQLPVLRARRQDVFWREHPEGIHISAIPDDPEGGVVISETLGREDQD